MIAIERGDQPRERRDGLQVAILRLYRVNCDNRRLCHSETTGFGIGQLMVSERRISRVLNYKVLHNEYFFSEYLFIDHIPLEIARC
jgi:hypothetical protein